MSERQQKLAEAARKKQVDRAEATKRANLAATKKAQKKIADDKAIAASQKREEKDIMQRRGKKDVSAAVERKKISKEQGHKDTVTSLEKEKLAREAEVVTPQPKKPVPPSQREVVTFFDRVQDLYKQTNMPTEAEIASVINSVDFKGIPGPANTATKKLAPANIVEGLYRVAYGVAETISGGVREATFGFSTDPNLSKRGPQAQVLQFFGAIATPTGADLAVGLVLNKIGASQAGRALLKKVKFAVQEFDDPIMGITTPSLTTKMKKLLTDIKNLGLLPDVDPYYDDAIKQFKKIDLEVSLPSDMISNANKYRDAQTSIRKTLEWKNPKSLDNVYQAADDAFFKKLIDDFREFVKIPTANDAKIAREYETLLTRARRYTISTGKSRGIPDAILEGLTDLPTIHDFPFTARSMDEIDYGKLMALLAKDGKTTEKTLGFIEYAQAIETTSGAAYITPEMDLITGAAYAWEIGVDDLLVYMGEAPQLFADGTLVAAMMSTYDYTDKVKLLRAMGTPENAISDMIKQLDKTPVIPHDYTDIAFRQVEIEDTDEGVVITPLDSTDTKPDEIIDTKPDEIIDTKPDEATIQEPLEDTITEEEPIQEEEPIETPLIKLSLKDKKKRKELNLSLFRGKKRLYEATYQHKAGRTETIGPIPARSLFDASQQAQRKRKSSKQIPRKGSIRLIGETKR